MAVLRERVYAYRLGRTVLHRDDKVLTAWNGLALAALARAGLVRSVRGAGGGYLLTRKPEEYSVGDILRPLEGDLAPVECATDGGYCEHSCDCVTVELWQDIHRAVSQVVDHTTLADLVERQRAHQHKSEPSACP